MRSVVITGVSRGLGAALFDEFFAAGDRVLAIGRHFTEAQRALADDAAQRVRLREVDLGDIASLPGVAELGGFLDLGDRAIERAANACGADGRQHSEIVLVHNAATFEPYGRIGRLGAAPIASAVAVNLTAALVLTDAVLACLAPGRRRTVVYVSSSAAHRVEGGRSVYGCTKRAGEMFVETLAAEHHDDPTVRALVIDPGIMDTEMQAVVRRHARFDDYFPGRERFLERYERGGLPSPVDVARRILAEHLA